jgi:hypothetical protein
MIPERKPKKEDTKMFKNYYYREIEHRSYANPNGAHITFLKDEGPLLTCRLCGKNEKETTFHLKAHCVPESFGNKALLSSRECDRCNKDLFAKYDSEIGRFTSLFRAGDGIAGKKGLANFKTDDFAIENENIGGKRVATITVSKIDPQKIISAEAGGRKALKAETKSKINTMWVYKSLLKSTLVLCDYRVFQEIKFLARLLFEAKTTIPLYYGVRFGKNEGFEGYSLYQMQSENRQGYPKYIARFSCGSLCFFLPLLMKTEPQGVQNFVNLFAIDFQMKGGDFFEAIDDQNNTTTAGGVLSGAAIQIN